MVEGEKEYRMYCKDVEDIWSEIPHKSYIMGYDTVGKAKKKEYYFCAELCPEYIDYLKKVLKPYLR